MHVIFWTFIMALPYLLKAPTANNYNPKIVIPTYYFSVLSLTNIPFFYFNTNFLIPKILKIKGFYMYCISIIATIFLLILFNSFLRQFLLNDSINYRILPGFGTAFQILFILAISTSYRILSDNLQEEDFRKERENERLKSELSFLRSQISPHFMFNVLNSIVSLSRRKPQMVEPVVIKLSELMRYMLYESDDAKVSLQREYKYLQSYIELQKIRFGDDVEVKFEHGLITEDKSIEPMLLIPFVENAFKHGVGMIERPLIEVFLGVEDHKLVFMVRNKFNHQFKETKDGSSGIGLNNVKRRLELLYPESHNLIISEQEDWYEVTLIIGND